MADLSDLLAPDLVATGLTAASKKSLFGQIGALAASRLGLDAKLLADALAAREKLGSTGFGGGTAIPHAKVPGVPRPTAVVTRLAQPIDYRAVDDAPVDIVVALFSAPDSGADHLKALARVARRLRDRDLVAKLRGAGSRDALWALMNADEARDAA
jgi:PTS system nitrogen regulatory IIA component